MLNARKTGLGEWAALLALVLMWGSSYYLTQAAIGVFTPVQITAARVGIGAVMLAVVLALRGDRLSARPKDWLYFTLMALLGNCLPFFLVTWGQQYIASGEAGIVMAMVPLTVLLIAHYTLPEEPASLRRVAGILLGLAGVVLLLRPENLRDLISDPSRQGQLAAVGAALSYACATVLAQRQPNRNLYQTAAGVLVVSSAIGAAALLADAARPAGTLTWSAVIAVLALGLLATGAATVTYFWLAARAGAGFLSLSNYGVPCVAAGLGALAAGERLPARAWTALAMVLAGIALAQGRPRLTRRRRNS